MGRGSRVGHSSHLRLTPTQEMASLYFEQSQVLHLPEPGHLPAHTTHQLCSDNGLSASCKASGPLRSPRSSEPSKNKSCFLSDNLLYIALCTIVNLGGLNTWTGLAHCHNTHHRQSETCSHPVGSCLKGGALSKGGAVS